MKQNESADNSQGQLFIVPTPIGIWLILLNARWKFYKPLI